MGASRYAISLRITHPSINPDTISAALGIAPKRAWKAGSPRSTPSGKPLAGTRTETYWTARLRESTGPSPSLAEDVRDALDQLTPHRTFLDHVRSENGRCEFFIGWFFDGQAGVVLPHELLERLGGLGIDLSFDAYGAPDEGSDEV